MTVAAENLRRFAADVFVAKGMRAEDAHAVADTLLWADLRGVGTHGVSRIPQYCTFIDSGDLDATAKPERSVDLPASARLDAQRAAGPVAMRMAAQLAMEKARAGGIGMVVVGRTTHTGALGCYTELMARAGFAGIAFGATSPWIAYHGSATAAVGTNPISIAVPGVSKEAGPIVLDMTPGATSLGQLVQARKQGKPLPPGVAADAQGRATTDAQLAQIILPIGGAKGSGLAFMLELLVSHLAHNPILADALEQQPESRRHRQNALVIAVDCSRFVEPEVLQGMVQKLADGIHALPRVEEGTPIRLPGERGSEEAKRRAVEGIPLAPTVQGELGALAAALGLEAKNYW